MITTAHMRRAKVQLLREYRDTHPIARGVTEGILDDFIRTVKEVASPGPARVTAQHVERMKRRNRNS